MVGRAHSHREISFRRVLGISIFYHRKENVKREPEINPLPIEQTANYQSAVATLGRCIDQLAESQIRDPNWLEATQILGQIDPQFAPLQIEAMADDRWQVCRALAVSVSKIGPSIFDDVVAALQHDHPNVRQFACGMLYGLHQRYNVHIEEAVEPLSSALLDPDCRVRHKAAVTLCFIGTRAPAAVPNLILALSDEDDFVREWAAHALAAIGPPAAEPAIDALHASLWDEEPSVQQAIFDALQVI